MKKINLKMKIGDSVTKYPELASVYIAYGVDYCCGGDREIGEAVTDSDADKKQIIDSLNEKLESIEKTGESILQLNELDNNQLIDHIITKHHSYLERILPQLSDYLFKLIKVHGQNHPELFEVHYLVGTLKIELESHLVKEEKQLFPLIRKEKYDEVKILIESLEKEHDAAGDILKQLVLVTDHFKLPEDACATYQLTYKLLQELQVDMYQHVHKENSVLFKRF